MTTRSTPTNRKIVRSVRSCAYVLWGAGFDEVLAVTFVTELRRAGLRVKLVGLRLQPMTGAYGVTLLPEIALDGVLAERERLSCLVIPCDKEVWQRLQQDPRLYQLLTRGETAPIPLLSCQLTMVPWLTAYQQIAIVPVGEALSSQIQQVIAIIKGL